MAKKIVAKMVLVILACLMPLATRAAEQPLTQDDVMLLLLGGASTEKMISLIERRGITFQMNPNLAKKFHDAGAEDTVIEALQKAGDKLASGKGQTPVVAPSGAEQSAIPAGPPGATRRAQEAIEKTSAPETPRSATTGSPAPSTSSEPKPAGIALSDPSPDQIQQVVREFAAKEKLFKEARNNYTYHQINKVNQLDPDNNVAGTFEQEWDILYDDSGKRIERVTYAPADTLKGLMVTGEDLNRWRNIQPFVMTTDDLPEYDIKYLGHTKVDEITAYVFSIRPKEIRKGQQYFQGVVWVDDRDLQIVKSEGKTVPETKGKGGQNLFPRFTTYREQIDGKYWFPTYTMSDDTLYFANGPIHIKEIIRYSEYKQFKTRVRILSTTPTDEPNAPAATPPPKK